MITLNITIGGNLELKLNKGYRKELKELIEKASNTDLILGDLLEAGNYTGNDWHHTEYGLTDAPIVAFGAVYSEDSEVDLPIAYDKVWYFSTYMTESFAETLLRDKKVIFKRA